MNMYQRDDPNSTDKQIQRLEREAAKKREEQREANRKMEEELKRAEVVAKRMERDRIRGSEVGRRVENHWGKRMDQMNNLQPRPRQ